MEQLKSLWESYYSVCDGVLFVFDAAETPQNLEVARNTLCNPLIFVF